MGKIDREAYTMESRKTWRFKKKKDKKNEETLRPSLPRKGTGFGEPTG